MDGLFSGILDERGSALVTAILVVSVALLALVVVFWIYRMRGGGGAPGRGGRRESRLAVIDSAMVDQRRRLVLVRRDDVEHLILIGGPADLVVESGIGTSLFGSAAMQPAAVPPVAVQPAPPAPQPPAPPRSAPEPAMAAERAPQSSAANAAPQSPATKAASPAVTAVSAVRQFPPERFATNDDDGAVKAGNPFDEAEFSAVLEAEMAKNAPKPKVPAFAGLDQSAAERARAAIPPVETTTHRPPAQEPKPSSLEEEMAKLLGDIKPERR